MSFDGFALKTFFIYLFDLINQIGISNEKETLYNVRLKLKLFFYFSEKHAHLLNDY